MADESEKSSSFKEFEQNLFEVVGSARTIWEIEDWIRSQPVVKAVRLENYYLKSNPPQREFAVQFNTGGRGVVGKVVNIFELEDGRFRFHEVRDDPWRRN